MANRLRILCILILTICCDFLFSSFFHIKIVIVPLLICFLFLNIICKICMPFEFLLFVLGIFLFRLLFYGTFFFDYKEVEMNLIFGDLSKKIELFIYAISTIISFSFFRRFGLKFVFKLNILIKIVFSLLLFIILYFLRSFFLDFVKLHQPYGSKIYLFNSLYIFYYMSLFLTGCFIPVTLLSILFVFKKCPYVSHFHPT